MQKAHKFAFFEIIAYLMGMKQYIMGKKKLLRSLEDEAKKPNARWVIFLKDGTEIRAKSERIVFLEDHIEFSREYLEGCFRSSRPLVGIPAAPGTVWIPINAISWVLEYFEDIPYTTEDVKIH